MGRIFPSNTTTPITPTTGGGGRIFGGSDVANKYLEEYTGPKNVDGSPKSWEQMSFGEKAWAFTKELPRTLYSFVPESTKQRAEEIHLATEKGGTAAGYKEVFKPESLKASLKAPVEFLSQIAGVSVQAVGGLLLGGVETVTGKPQKYEIPGIKPVSEALGLKGIPSEISSYQQQSQDLQKQGFSQNEARALVGINAYLGLMPLVAKGLKTKTGQALVKKTTTKEVPFAETPEGIKQTIIDTARLEQLKSEISQLKSPKAIAERTTEISQIESRIKPEIVRVERPIITGIKKIVGKTEEQKQFHEVLQKHTDKFFEGRSELLSKEEPLNKALVELSDTELANYSKFTQGFEIPKAEITPKLKTAVDLWKKVSQEEQSYLIEKGKLTLEQIENRRWKPVETIIGRGREELKAMGVDPQYYPYLAEDLLKKSDFISTTGKRTQGGYLKRFTGKMLQEDSYIKNPKIAIPRHRLQVFRDKMNSELVDTIKETFAEQDKTIIKKYKSDPRFANQMGVEKWKPAGTLRFYPIIEEGAKKAIGVTKKVESYWIPKEIVKELNRFSKPGILEKTLRMTYDPLIDMWRVSVLGMVPRWLYNNFVGNTILAILGKTDPWAFIKSAKEIFARTKLGEKLGIGKREIPEKVFMKEYAGGELAKAGQLGSLAREQTQFLRPIENWLNLLEQAKNYKIFRIPAIATQNLIRGWIALGKPIGYLNKVTENWFRGAMYISKSEGKFLGLQLDKPVPPVEGLKYVNEFLFDYGKLSRVERATFRRALPFWNWQKNITAFALKFPVNHPMRGLIVGVLLQDYVDYINEVNQKEDKTKSVLRIKTNITYENKPLYINVKSAIPFSDVFRTIPTDFETFGRFLTSNPVSKIIIERGFKINSFTGQPFTQPSELQQFDEYGKPVLPLPSLPRHIGQQLPQVKMGQQALDYLRYDQSLKRFETGEPKIYRGQVQTTDLLMEILKYFGVSISAIEYNKIQQSVERKGRRQEVKERRYERQLETGLERLKNQ